MSMLQFFTIAYIAATLPLLLVFYGACVAAGNAGRILKPDETSQANEQGEISLQTQTAAFQRY